MIRILSTLAFFIFFGNLPAQWEILGTVQGPDSLPLPGALVYLHGTYDGATTDSLGRFAFSTTESGQQTLVVEFPEMKTQTRPLVPGSGLVISVSMEEAFSELKAVSITAGAFEAGDRKKAVVLSSLDMVTTAGSAGDVYGALQTLPGTSTVGESGRLFVRGGTGRETATFIDGALVQSPYAATAPGTPTRGRFNPFMFDGVVFSTGGFSAEYGQALSSVVLLSTHGVPEEDRFDIGILSVGGSLAGTKTWDGGGVSADLSYTNVRPYFALVPQNYRWNRAPEGGSGAISIRQKTGRSGLLKVYANHSFNRMDLAQEDPNATDGYSNFRLRNDNSYFNASWKGLIQEKWTLQTTASLTFSPEDIHLDGGSFNRQQDGAHLKAVGVHQLTEKAKVRIGAEYFTDRYGERFQSNQIDFAQSYTGQRLAAFGELDLYTSGRFVFRTGARWVWDGYASRQHFSPRLSAAYRLTDHAQLSVAAGRFRQAVQPDILLYTSKLEDEQADHLLLGYQHQKKNRFFRAEAYFKGYSRLVRFTDADLRQPDSYDNGGRGHAYGLDLVWKDRSTIKNGDFWLSYSFVNTLRQHLDFPELATPGFASRHNFSLVYKHWLSSLRSQVGLTAAYGSPRTYTDPNQPGFQNARTLAYKTLDLNWSYLHRENVIFHLAVSNVPGFEQSFGQQFADQPNPDGSYPASTIRPPARRFIVLGCFITFSPDPTKNQLDNIQ